MDGLILHLGIPFAVVKVTLVLTAILLLAAAYRSRELHRNLFWRALAALGFLLGLTALVAITYL